MVIDAPTYITWVSPGGRGVENYLRLQQQEDSKDILPEASGRNYAQSLPNPLN